MALPKSNGICRVPIGERFFAWTKNKHIVVQRLEALYVKAIQNRRIKVNVTADLRDHSTLREGAAAALLSLLDNDQALFLHR
ncbi:hypothetical protein [Bradyrhizobium retamae]|uniref:hypothetical protein n=1 Tax=Bradyrhizobium retamae TaxID=1300035 RepID=UPI0018D2686F|nr:hypothetical protein [Bradyrhizobium retamae]